MTPVGGMPEIHPTVFAELDAAKNHFELFGLPTSFTVDTNRLAERYRALSTQARADTALATASPAQLDEAYRTLLDPLARARYLLRLHGRELGRGRGNAGLLVEQLELREQLQEVSNRTRTALAVSSVLTDLAEQSAVLAKELRTLFEDPSTDNLELAHDLVHQLEFIALCRRDAEQRRDALQRRG
ncbi:Fe-S protein assembly co-chaperone HscB [Marichromatium gracile]|uniref:Fe-S protein assembly co-chaperone HscB n=1 Tax=Marichromatium gracile TaxID=1048 RepID=UPI001F25FCB0|nr:Fe-S protein assembly co-chaperone HscB [Marichromatium gracile]